MTEFKKSIAELMSQVVKRAALEYLLEHNRNDEYQELLDHIRKDNALEAKIMSMYWFYKSKREQLAKATITSA